MTDPDATPQDDAAALVLDGLPSGARVVVWRRDDAGDQVYCGRIDAELAARDGIEEAIRARWGGGRFLVRVAAGPCRRYQPGGGTVHIAGRPRDPDATPAAPTSSSSAAGDAEPPAWARALLRERPAASADPWDGLAKLGALTQSQAAAQMQSMVALITTMMEHLSKRPGPTGGASAKVALDALREGMELGIQAAGAQADTGSLVDRLGARFLAIMDRAAAQTAAAPDPQHGALAPMPTWTPERPASPFAALAPYMATLHAAAVADEPVAAWAAVVEESANDLVGQVAAIVERMGMAPTLDLFLATFPAARPAARWYAALLAELAPPADPEDEPEDEP